MPKYNIGGKKHRVDTRAGQIIVRGLCDLVARIVVVKSAGLTLDTSAAIIAPRLLD